MNLNKTILVNQGQAMITEAINTSQPIILTKFTIGKGTVATENAALALTNVVLSHRDVAIANHTQEGNVYKCTCYYDNKTEPADVTIKEIGLYGKVGASGTVKLFAYVTFEPGDYLPIGGGSVYSEYSKILNVGITELATVESVVNIIVENATKTSLGVVQIGNGVAVNTNGVISLGTTNDGLIINASDIKLDTQNTLTSTSITKPLSANMGKQLQDTKANETTQIIAGSGLTGGGDLSANRTINVVSANAGITVNADNIELKPATTSVIGGVKPDGTTTSVDVNGVISTVNRASISTQIIAGTGLTGGGDLTASRTLNVASANDGITVNADNIQLNVQNVLTSTSTTQPLSAEQGRVLDTKNTALGILVDKKLDNIGIEIQSGINLDTIRTCGHYKCASSYEAGRILNNPFGAKAFTLVVDSISGNASYVLQTAYSLYNEVKTRYFIAEGFNTWSSWVTVLSEKDVINNLISTSESLPLSAGQGKILQDTKLNLTGGTLTGILNGTTATFSGNVTAPRLIMTSAQATGDGDAVRYDFANSTYFTNNPKTIPANTNLNTFLTKGHYTSVDDAITATMFNTPFGILSFTLVVDGIQDNNMYISQLATNYYGTIAQRITQDAGITWTPWTEIINKTTGDATYVKKTGDTMTGQLNGTSASFSGDVNIENLAIGAEIGHTVTSGHYAYSQCRVKESDSSSNYFRMWSDHNHNVLEYYGSGGLSGNPKTFFYHNKSTGVVSYAGGNYGTINGSTATFSGNVTAPSITIGGYVVTIV